MHRGDTPEFKTVAYMTDEQTGEQYEFVPDVEKGESIVFAVKESEEDEDSIKIKRKNKKKLEKREHSSEKDELPEPTIKKKKRVLLNRIMENNRDKGKEDNNKKGEEENNHHENNHVNNNVNNHIEQEINTDIKDINNKIDEI